MTDENNTESQHSFGPPTVAKVVDSYTLVVNRGADQGIKKGMRALVYSLGEELFDPVTRHSLGQLEIVRGTGVVTHVQPLMCTVVSDQVEKGRATKILRRKNSSLARAMMIDGDEEIVETEPDRRLPFERPELGDRVRWITAR